MAIDWRGVFPAITTPFHPSGDIDLEFFAEHLSWMLAEGCHGVVPCGSLGESATLTIAEKVSLMAKAVDIAGEKPVIPGIASLSTQEAVFLAKEAERVGCRGLMVLPPYAYSTDWVEMRAHVAAVIAATSLDCMLYNNPVAYKTDFLPTHVADLAAEFPNLTAVKESSADVRRIMAIRELIDGRLSLLVGVDDAIVEALRVGAVGWIAGLVNAFPAESVAIWRGTLDGEEVDDLYKWFLPLLRLDVVPKFVQLIKLTQQEVGRGSERVRGPRLQLVGAEREAALQIIRHGIQARP